MNWTEEKKAKIQHHYTRKVSEILEHEEWWKVYEVEDNEENIQFGENGVVMGFTVSKCIQRITSHDGSVYNPSEMKAFMLTYRSIMEQQELMTHLLHRFNTPPWLPEHLEDFDEFLQTFLMPMRTRLVQLIEHWINNFFFDFRFEREMSQAMLSMLDEMKQVTAIRQQAENLLEMFQKAKNRKSVLRFLEQRKSRRSIGETSNSAPASPIASEEISTKSTQSPIRRRLITLRGISGAHSRSFGSSGNLDHTSSMPTPLYPKGMTATSDLKNAPLLQWSTVEVARQLTLIDHALLQKVLPKECFNRAWNSENRRAKAPNIHAIIKRSNDLSMFVAYEILKVDNLKQRSYTMKKFIKMAKHCRNLHNYFAVMSIIGGLTMAPVYRLKKTWDALPKEQREYFEELNELISFKHNYKGLREELKKAHPPCVPYMGLYFNDFLYIEEGNPDTINNGLVNFHKRRLFSEIIRMIQAYQSSPYDLQEIPELAERLKNLRIDFEEEETATAAATAAPNNGTSTNQSPAKRIQDRVGSAGMVALSFMKELHQEKSQDKDMKDVLNKLSQKHEPKIRDKHKSHLFSGLIKRTASK